MSNPVVGEVQAFTEFAKRVPVSRQMAANAELLAGWLDVAAHTSGASSTNAGSLQLTNAILHHLRRQGINDTTMARAFRMARTQFASHAFGFPLLPVGDLQMKLNQGPAMGRSETSLAQALQATAAHMAWQYEIAVRSGNAKEQARLESMAVELLMAHGQALLNRTQMMSVGQEMLQNIRMNSNVVTIPTRR
jgi:urease gamma subunit